MTRQLRLLALTVAAMAIGAVPAVSLAERGAPAAPPSLQSVGSVASFADGVLAIEVADGSTVSGRITDRSWVGCSRGKRGKHRVITRMRRAPKQAVGASGAGGEQERGSGHPRPTCDLSAVIAGTKVLAANLSLTADGPVWKLVVFLTPPPVATGPTGASGAQPSAT